MDGALDSGGGELEGRKQQATPERTTSKQHVPGSASSRSAKLPPEPLSSGGLPGAIGSSKKNRTTPVSSGKKDVKKASRTAKVKKAVLKPKLAQKPKHNAASRQKVARELQASGRTLTAGQQLFAEAMANDESAPVSAANVQLALSKVEGHLAIGIRWVYLGDGLDADGSASAEEISKRAAALTALQELRRELSLITPVLRSFNASQDKDPDVYTPAFLKESIDDAADNGFRLPPMYAIRWLERQSKQLLDATKVSIEKVWVEFITSPDAELHKCTVDGAMFDDWLALVKPLRKADSPFRFVERFMRTPSSSNTEPTPTVQPTVLVDASGDVQIDTETGGALAALHSKLVLAGFTCLFS